MRLQRQIARLLCSLAALLTAALVVSLPAARAAPPKAATLNVTTASDELVPRDGKCSLREAIAAVDAPGTATDCGTAARGSNTIVLRPGHYALSLVPRGGNDNRSGDLNVTGSARLTIAGAGSFATVIDAQRLHDRVLSIAGAATVRVSRLTITGGHPAAARQGSTGIGNASCTAGGAGGDGSGAGSAGSGGAVYNSGTLTLSEATVVGNTAGAGGGGGDGGTQSAANGCGGGNGGQGGDGGGIYNAGRLVIANSTVRANRAGVGGTGGAGGTSAAGTGGSGGNGGPGGGGGGVYNQGRLAVIASTFSGNRAGAGGTGGTGGAGTPARGVDGAGGPGSAGGGVFSLHGSLKASNSTLAGNFAGAGGAGGGLAGNGGAGGSGGAVAVTAGASALSNATVARNGAGAGGAAGSSGGTPGSGGSGGALFVQSGSAADDMGLKNTIVAFNLGPACAGSPSAIAGGGHDLVYGDRTCPGERGNPRLGSLKDNGGPTATLALGRGSAAIDRVPARGGGCPQTDQRGVDRPQGEACDIGAFEFALPVITIISPRRGGSYERGSQIHARYRCSEGGITSPVASCEGTVPRGHPLATGSVRTKSFTVIAVDKTGNKLKETVRYVVWSYTNPLKAVKGLFAGRIDMGVDYAGSGPILALGKGRVVVASNHDSGPPRCWGRTCWPGGGIVVYKLADGPFTGKYVYVAEHITVGVRAGQTVRAGQRIATLHPGLPDMETGWASGKGPETLAIARGHQCTCGDPGGWSTIEGRNFDELLIVLGAPSGYVQPNPPSQRMPPGWPRVSAAAGTVLPRSGISLPEGALPLWR